MVQPMQDLYIIWDDKFAKRVIDNLEKDPEKLDSIVGIDKVPSNAPVSSPSFIDKVGEHLPSDLPSCDIILAIGVGSYLLAIPTMAEEMGAKGVIIPIEKSNWYPLGLLNQVKKDLKRKNIEYAFPRPFCSLVSRGRENIAKFVRDFGIGRPSLKIDVKDGKISDVEVEVSAPCGSTHAVAKRIKGCPASFESSDLLELEERTSKAWHGYPCTADMEIDSQLEEAILHRAGYITREAVKEAVGLTREPDEESKKLFEECSKLCEECIKSCERSSTGILEIQEDKIVIPDYTKCTGCRHCVKVCPIDVTGKLVTERDTILLRKWENQNLSN